YESQPIPIRRSSGLLPGGHTDKGRPESFRHHLLRQPLRWQRDRHIKGKNENCRIFADAVQPSPLAAARSDREAVVRQIAEQAVRSEEHTSELQSREN